MNFFKRFQNGFNTATQSFNFLWENKKLLIYLGIPIILGVLIEILIYNIKLHPTAICTSFSQKNAIARILLFGASYNWLRYISVIFIYFIYLAIITWANISLSTHTYFIFKRKHPGLRNVITESMSKIPKAILWTCFILIPIVMFYMINAHIQKTPAMFAKFFYFLIIFSIFIFWSIITLFVIQAIAIDNANIKQTIKNSLSAVKRVFFEYLGAMVWIGLAGTIFALPFVVLEKFVHALYIFAIPAILIIYCYISSAYTVAKTLLYIKSKEE